MELQSSTSIDQLALPGAVEHDVSLTRWDFGQGDNITPQEDLMAYLLAVSSNGTEITSEDFTTRRRQRLEQQECDNPLLQFDSMANQLGCTEISLIQRLFGNAKKGYSVPMPYAKTLSRKRDCQSKRGGRRGNGGHLVSLS